MEEKLQVWATRLTSCHRLFSHDHTLAPHHFKNLAQDKNLQPCLSHLLHHVLPPAQLRQVKLNLKLARLRKSLQGDGESSGSQDYLRLKATIVETRAAISAEVAEIQQLNQRQEEVRQEESEVRRRVALVQVARRDRERLTQHYGKWSAHLRDLLQEGALQEERKHAKSNMAVKKQLQEDLCDLKMLLHSVISERPGSTLHATHQRKVRLWESVEESVMEWGPRVMLAGMVGEVREALHALHTLLQKVDLARDAHHLRVKCESDGTFIDEMDPGGVVESVRELLQQMSGVHVKLYLEAHRDNQAAHSLGRALTALTNSISTVAKRTYSESEVAEAVVGLVKANLALAGERAFLSTAQTLTATLQDQADAAARGRNAVKEKYAEIINFEKKIQDRIETIQCFATSIQDSWQSISDRKAQLKSSVMEALSSTTCPTPVSPNALQSECEGLASLPLAFILTTQIEGSGSRQKINMSTSPLVWHSPEAAGVGWEMAGKLCEGMRCWEGVQEAACHALRRVERLTALREALTATMKQSPAHSTHHIKELLKKVETSDRQLEKEVTEMLEDLEKKLTKGSQLASTVTRLIADWWEQPAKHIHLKEV